MIAATYTERSVLVSILSLLLLFTGACSESNADEKIEKRVPSSSKAKPVTPNAVDTVAKPVQDSVQKPTQMMNYKSFRKSYTIHKRGYVVSLLSKLYKA